MVLPDVNVLIYAFRQDAAQHEVCRDWLQQILDGDARFGVSQLVLSAFVRLTTNHRVYAEPSSLDEAFGFCAQLREQSHCQIVEPGDRHWAIFERLCRETRTTGARVTDAWLAALAIEHGCEWITFDRDFARFTGLRWSEPE